MTNREIKEVEVEFEEISVRRSGRTTRTIDQAVQLLFRQGHLSLHPDNADIYDHSYINREPFKTKIGEQIYIYDRVLYRLGMEHPNIKIEQNSTMLTIQIAK